MTHANQTMMESYLEYLNSQILGNRDNNELMFAACINPNPTNIIIIGSPGTSKTTSVNIISRLLGQPFAKVQATPNLDINKVLGPVDLKKLVVDKVEQIKWSNWTKAYFKFIDEFNRLTPESAVSLMELLDTSRGKRSLHINQHEAPTLPAGPLFATMNNSDSATNDVFPPMLDRFDICIIMKHPHSHDLYRIGTGELRNVQAPHALTQEQFDSIKSEVQKIRISEGLLRYMALLVRDLSFCNFGEMASKTTAAHEHCAKACFFCPKIDHRTPASPRVLLSIVSMSKALAYLRGKPEVTSEEIRSLIVPAVRHRVRLQLSYLNKFNNANDAYDDLASELKSRQLQRESMHSELEKITRAIASNSISNETRAAFQRISQFAKSDGVYGEMISIELSEFRRRLG